MSDSPGINTLPLASITVAPAGADQHAHAFDQGFMLSVKDAGVGDEHGRHGRVLLRHARDAQRQGHTDRRRD